MKLCSILLNKLLPTLKWAINSPVWRENNISGGLFQSRLSFRTEMKQSVRWCHLSRAQKTNKSNKFWSLRVHQSISCISEVNYCVLFQPEHVQGPSRAHTGAPSMAVTTGVIVIMAATCSTQSLYCKYAFTLKAHREREKTLSCPPPASVSPSSVLQMLRSFCALCKWWIRSGARGLNQAKIRMFPL